MKTKAEIEADAVREKLERLHEQGAFPATPAIKRFDVVPDYDSTGDPAYYIAVLLDDATPDDELTPEKMRPIRRIVFDNVVRGPDEPWPYIRILREWEYLAPVEEW
jgi:hypothetical protein